MPTFNFDVKKLVIWLAILPVVIVVGAMAFSPKGAVAPVVPAAPVAAQGVAPAAPTPNTPVLKPTALPVMYEFFTGW